MSGLIIYNIIVDLTLILLPAIYLCWKRKPIAQSLGLVPKGVKEEAVNTLILFLVLVLLSVLLSLAFGMLGIDDLAKVDATITSLKAAAPYFIIYLMVVRVFSEEIFFRGFLVERLGIFGSAGLFAAAHLFYGSLAEIAGAFVLGVGLAAAYARNKSLLPNILAHMLYNFVVLVAII